LESELTKQNYLSNLNMNIAETKNNAVLNINLQKAFADDKLSSDEIEKDKNAEESHYEEKRYCTVCNIEQPLRSKHCKDCKRCVALYDHHCPWTGSSYKCKNKKYVF